MSVQENDCQNKAEAGSIVSGLTRPQWWICSIVKQVVALLRDDSGSMSGQKAADASAASLDLIAELAAPANKDGFEVAIIDFAEYATVAHQLTKATELHGKARPPHAEGGSTNITDALEKASGIVEQVERLEEQHLQSVVILFSDGCHNTGPDPRAAAQVLREKADLVTVAFGADADETLLKELATSPQHFYRCKNGRDLRAFLAAVGATMSQTLGARQNATQALSQIQQGRS